MKKKNEKEYFEEIIYIVMFMFTNIYIIYH